MARFGQLETATVVEVRARVFRVRLRGSEPFDDLVRSCAALATSRKLGEVVIARDHALDVAAAALRLYEGDVKPNEGSA